MIILSLATDFPKTEARIPDFGNVGVQTTELIIKIVGDSMKIGDRMEISETEVLPLTSPPS